MKSNQSFRFPSIDSVMNAAVMCAIATMLGLAVFSSDVLSVVA